MSLDDLAARDRDAVLDFLTALGDDEYIHGDRLSSWLTVAPTLEEDNVLTSIAQDEMGHARLWYELVADHRETDVDELAIFRAPDRRRNSTLVEREFDDFADTVVRSFLYDRAERLVLEAIEEGAVAAVADRASVALDEETFHREHVDEWLDVFASLQRQADRDRVREAVVSNLSHADDLFAFPDAERLTEMGVLARSPDALAATWRERVLPTLAELPIGMTETDLEETLDEEGPDGRRGDHTGDLETLIDRLQPREIERLDA